MILIHKKSQGFTLLEIVLVFAIAAAITLIGIRQYQTYRRGADLEQIKFNVEALFQAMAEYYRAQCYGQTDANGVLIPGVLNPSKNPPVNQPVDIFTDLLKEGRLTTNVGTSLYLSPYVDTAGPGYNGYIAQFNREPDQQRRQCIENASGGAASGPAASQNCSTSGPIATIVNWRAQVAVHVDPAKAQSLSDSLGADCVSKTSQNFNVIFPCGKVPQGGVGDYIVWSRTPSAALRTEQSPLWQTNPSVEQFKQMYTTYPTTLLLNTSGSVPGGGQQYILCGG